MSKAPLSIPEREHVPVDIGVQQTVFPLLLPLLILLLPLTFYPELSEGDLHPESAK